MKPCISICRGRQFSRLADEYNLPRSLGHALQYLGGLHDELIRQLGITLLAAMLTETSTSRMLAESASIMLAAQLAHRYSGADLLRPGGGHERPEGARLRRVLDYIEANIETDISVEALADVAALSVFHFTRLFTAAMGQPPRKYVSRRRLETAMAMLARDKFSLNEIAHKSRFSSQAAFSARLPPRNWNDAWRIPTARPIADIRPRLHEGNSKCDQKNGNAGQTKRVVLR